MKKIARLMTLALVVFALASCEDVPSPFGTVTPPKGDSRGSDIPPTGTGTATDPFNVQKAIDFVKELGADVESETTLYVKGKVLSISEISASYGNASFILSDDTEGTNKFTAYRVKGFNNQKITDEKMIKVGDDVIICGKIVNYKGNTPETVQNTGYIYSVNGKTGGDPAPTGEYGTKDAPLTVAKALEVINGLEPAGTASPAYVKGKISKVQSFNDKYKSITYYISDDGTDNNALQVYSGKGIDGADFAAQTDLEAGWTVIVTGELKKYVNSSTGATTPEINQSSTIVSIDKTTGGNTTPDEGKTKKVSVAEFLAASESTSDWYQLTGTVTHLEDGTYNNSTKYGNFDLVDETGSIYVYGVVTEKGGAKGQFADLMAAKGIKDGCKITIIGNRGSYKGTAQVVNAYFVSVEAGSGDNTGDNTGGDTSGGSSITAAFGDLDCSNIAAIKLSDGTTIAVAQEDGKSAPIYHESTKIIRIYARNSVTINAGSKKISKVELAYDTYNGTAYKGNDEMYGEAGSSKLTPAKDDKNVTFSNVNSSTLKVVNWLESGNSGGTQFRITGLTITYAQ